MNCVKEYIEEKSDISMKDYLGERFFSYFLLSRHLHFAMNKLVLTKAKSSCFQVCNFRKGEVILEIVFEISHVLQSPIGTVYDKMTEGNISGKRDHKKRTVKNLGWQFKRPDRNETFCC